MTLGNAFFFIAGAIATIALLVVIYPWIAGRPRGELRAALPRWVPWAGGGALAIVLAVYVALGMPQLLSHDATPVTVTGNAATSKTAASMDSAVQGLERRLAAGGGTDGDWELLAKSYEFLGRPDDAALARQKRLPADTNTSTAAPQAGATPEAASAVLSPQARQLLAAANTARSKRDFAGARDQYEKLVARHEMTADAWADFADVAATLNGRSLQGKPAEYLAIALRLDPRHPKALWLEASLQHESGQYRAATQSWQRLAAVLGADSPDAKVVAANLAEDQRLAGGGPSEAAAAGANSGTVRGEVIVASALKGKIPAGLTLFIVAKSVNSPGPPVAIWKTSTTGNWPIEFSLDDSQAMVPMRKLSTAGPVTIEARTSRTGQAMPAPGDFQGVSAQLVPGSANRVRVVIEKVIG
jgi:cytochrome c-type biogenesis protein CcmH/NrfG